MSGALERFLAQRIRERPWQAQPLETPVSLDDVPTPALIVDVEAMERNLAYMAESLGNKNVGLRAHSKMHKCPLIARRQLELGAVGICCAKVAEAEVMCAAGISRILITSPVVSPDKAARVAELVSAAEHLMVVADSELGIERLSAAAAQAGVTLPVLVDMDPLMGRTGASFGDRSVELVQRCVAAPSLAFGGLQMYAGHVMHIQGYAPRREKSRKFWEMGLETRGLVEARGFQVEVMTGGGTGTYNIDCDIEGVTDIQAGSYALMDREYRDIGGTGTEVFDDFEPALFVLTTAISQPRDGAITVDAGIKSFATDTVAPSPAEDAGMKYRFAGDEHGVLLLEGANRSVALGDRIKILVPHCDPTINLYDFLVPHRNGEVVELWPITGRGCSW
ncbi:MAG: DSD1 family PLP-dependent enzyme [Pseudomonadales bacterium]